MSKAQVFAFRVKRLREAEHMTQEQLGAATGYSQQQVARWEAGKYLPLTEALVAIADYFNVRTDYLLGRIDDPVQPVDELTEDERQVIDLLRRQRKKHTQPQT